MNAKLQKIIVCMSKTAIYAMVFHLSLLTLAFAGETEAQQKELREIEVSVSPGEKALLDFLKELEQKSDFTFAYTAKELKKKSVILRKGNWRIDKLLEDISFQASVSFKRVNETITVRQINLKKSLPVVIDRVYQSFTVTGKVVSLESPEGLPGVNVRIKDTNLGTVTEVNGAYSIEVPSEEAILLFSSVGFVTEEIVVGSQSVIDVILIPDVTALAEIVVIGYGTVEKKDLTTAVTSMKQKDFIQGTPSPLMSIQGKVPGLSIVSSSGTDPNSDLNYQLRGINSINAHQGPLIVIDGVPGGSLSAVVREDIQSIDVLRDASASAIYGTRASGGVILITTKQPQPGKTNVTFTSEAYLETIRKRPEVLSAEEFVAYDRGDDLGNRTDWYDEVTNDNPISSRNVLSLSGGTENAQIYAQVNYRDAKGMAIGSERKEYGGRLNTAFKFLNGVAEISSQISYNHRNSNFTDNNIFNMALLMNPTETPYDPTDPTGYNVLTAGFDYFNPVAEVMLKKDQREYKNLLANSILKVNITDNLNTSVLIGVNNRSEFPRFYRSAQHRESRANNIAGYAKQEYKSWNDRTFEWTVNYKKIVGDHSVNSVVGYTYQDFNGQGFWAENSDFAVDGLEENSLQTGTFLPDGRAKIESWKSPSVKLAAFLGRVNYTFKDRYFLSASLRYEGSSKFSEKNRWGTFPGISAGWRLSEESFLQNLDMLSDLKLRGSYGETGNEGFNSEVAFRMYSPDTWWLVDGEWYRTYGVRHNQNEDIKWEVKKEFNAGFDFGLFKNRLTGRFDYYSRRVDDMIYEISVSQPPAIHDKTFMNVGNLDNRGWEAELTGLIIDKEDLEYATTLTFSHNKSILKSLWGSATFQDRKGFPAPGSPGDAVRLYPGEEIGRFFIWRHAGFTEDGKWMLYDKDGNAFDVSQQQKTIDDKDFVGNAIPRVMLSWNHSVNYKNFDAGIYMRSWLGFDVYNMINMYYSIPNVANQNVLRTAYGEHKDITGEKELSDYWLEKGDFLKVDAISIGYTIAKEVIPAFKSLRIYATGRDLFVFTNYSGLDPEVNINGLEPGFEERNPYPKTRTFMVGLQANF